MSRSGRGSERPAGARRGRPALRAAALALIAGATLAAAAAAAPVTAVPQDPPAPVGAAPALARVEVVVDGLPADEATLALVSLRAGDPASARVIDRALKQLHQAGLFSEIRIVRLSDAPPAVRVELTRRLRVKGVSFEPGRPLPQSALREGVESLRPGGYFEEEMARRAVEEAREALRKAGFFRAEIEVEPKTDREDASVAVTLRVASWVRYAVRGVTVEGGLPTERDRRLGPTVRPGALYVPSEIEADLRRIQARYVSLGYQRAQVVLRKEAFDEAALAVDLTIGVDAGERIAIEIRGAVVPPSLVAPIWEERIFEEWGLSEGEARILARLRREGYLFASVKSRLERAPGELKVVHEVEPGVQRTIAGMRFVGLTSMTPEALRRGLGVGERILFFPLVTGDRLYELPREIEILLQGEGYPQARVELGWEGAGKEVTAVFTVREGPRQAVRTVEVRGARLFAPAELVGALVSVRGGPYLPANVQRDLEKLATFYLDRGVRGTRVASQVDEVAGGAFDLTYTVAEGSPVRIADVVVAGNRATRTATILREILVRKGELARSGLIQESRRRLEKLGIFSEVRFDEIAVSPGRENLVVTVAEGQRNYASLGVGLETKNDPRSVALVENMIRPRGTAEYIRSNIFGSAAQLSLVTQFSLIEKRAVASWEQPYILGARLPLTLTGWIEDEDRTSFGFDRRGVSASTSRAWGRAVVLGTLGWYRTRLTFLNIAENEVDRQLYPFSTTLASVSLIWDRRDDSFNPEAGTFLSVVGEWAYPLFGTEAQYVKGFVKLQSFRTLIPGFNLGLTVRGGLGRGSIPIPERFFAGGSNSFRGEAFDRLGPADPDSGMPIGGKAMFLVNLEMRFPLIRDLRDLRAAVFYDLGNVYAQRDDFSLFDLQGAAGLGLRYRTPLGPVRFDVGWNLDDPRRKGKPILFITIGNVF